MSYRVVENTKDYPEIGEMWVVTDDKGLQQAIFLCPCVTNIADPKHFVTRLPVNNGTGWILTVSDHKPTITPSIHTDFDKPISCHYFITDGEVQWA